MATTVQFNLHPAQRAILARRTRRNVVRCGRKFGKTKLTRRIFVGGAQVKEFQAYVAPEYSYLLEWWDGFYRTYRSLIEYNDVKNKQIRFWNGAKIDLGSLDNFDNLRPREYDNLVFDEASYSRYIKEAWEESLRATLTARKGDCWMLSTPSTKKGGPYFKEKCLSPDWTESHYTSYDNPHLDRAEIDEAKRELPTLVFQQEYLAEFVDFIGALVKAEHIRDREYDDADEPAGISWVVGVDPATSLKTHADYTGIVVCGVDQTTGNVYIREASESKVEFYELLQKIIQANERHSPHLINVEEVAFQGSIKQEITRTTRIPIRGVRPKGDKVQRFMPLLTRFEQGKVYLHKSLPKSFRDQLLTFPDCEHDDMVDALVYAYMGASKRQASGVAWA